MKKWNRKYIIGLLIYSFLLFLLFVTIIICKNRNVFYNLDLLIDLFWLLTFFLFIAVLIIFLVNAVSVIRNGMHNMRECGDALFKEMDQYRKCWRESNAYYIKRIQVINYYYKENGKVDDLIKKQELGRLFARMDYLDVHINFYDHLMTLFHSLVLSIIASIMCTVIEEEKGIVTISGLILFFAIFLFIIYWKYSKRGQDESYDYLLFEYEKKLLSKKIGELEKCLNIEADDEYVLLIKQKVINELIRICGREIRKKQKAEVINDIEIVESLDLFLEDYPACSQKKIYIENEVYKLPCDIDDESKAITAQEKDNYLKFYKILEKYGMIGMKKNQNTNNKVSVGRLFWIFEKEKMLLVFVCTMYFLALADSILFSFLENMLIQNITWRLGVILGISIIFSILFVIIDFRHRRKYIDGLCFQIILASRNKETYKRFAEIRKCLLTYKNTKDEQSEIDIFTNISVVEAALAYDKTYSVILPIFFTVIYTVLGHDLLNSYIPHVIGLIDILVLLILLMYVKMLPRNAFIKKVIESVKKEKKL